MPSLTQDTILNEFIFTVNLSNALVVNNRRTFPLRAYIEKGNNGMVVRSVLNRRWWWHTVEDQDSCNLMWSEWNRMDFVETLEKNFRIGPKKDTLSENSTESKKIYRINSTSSPVKPNRSDELPDKKVIVGKIINLKKFDKIPSKISRSHDHYYSFSKKLRDGFPVELSESLIPSMFSSVR